MSGYVSNKYDTDKMLILTKIIDEGFSISVISKIEILSWKADEEIEKVMKDFVDGSSVLSLSEEICDHTIVIRRKKNIKTPDAIIAATAILYNLTLITENEKDFANIKGLKITHPDRLSI